MRKIFTLVAAILLAVTVWAQSGCPQKMSYQAVVRNAANELVTNTTGITVEIMISDGTISYSETHTVSSNQNGLISFMIGQDGTNIQGSMDNMDWPNANMTTTVTVPDELPVVSTTEVVAVPYALYACEINPDGVNITKIKTDIYNHIQDTLSNYYTKAEADNKYETKSALCDDVIACVDGKLADATSTTNNAIDTIVNNQIMKAAADSLISTRELADSLNNYKIQDCEDVITCVDNAIADGSSTTNNAIDTIVKNIIASAEKDSLITTRELTDSLSNYKIQDCEDVITCVDNAIADGSATTNNAIDTIVKNIIASAEKDSLITTRELTDSLSNYKIQDCEDVITCVDNAIADGSSTTNNAIDTIVKYNVLTELQDGTSDINHTVDTIVNNQIMKAAADSLISTRELTDSLSNYTETSKLCEYITTNCTDIALDSEIPTVNNSTITIKQGDSNLGSFTLNQEGATTITIPTPDAQAQSDWAQTDDTKADYIKNKPNIEKIVRDSLVNGNSAINHVVDTIVNNQIVKAAADSLISTRELTDSLSNYKIQDCEDVITCVDNAIADGTSTTNLAIDTIVTNVANNLIEKAAADSLISTRELTDSLKNYTETSKLCEYITTNCTDIALDSEIPTVNNSTITIKQGDTNLGSFTLNQEGATTITIPTADAQAQSDWAQTDDTKADYIKNKPNIEKIVRDSLVNGNSAINHVVDTIVNNQIMKAAADSLISTRELTDSLSNYTETSKLCEYITTNCTDIALDSEIPTVNNSTITIKQGDSNLGSFTLNQEGATTITIPTADAQAQSDWAQTDDTKADYIKNKPNIEKIVRDSLVNGNSAINSVVDTIVNNQIMKAAADSLISTRELTDSLSNYTETSKLCEYITTNCTDIALDSEISNKTVTIKAADGTTTVGSFTLNQNTDVTITLPTSATQEQADWNQTDNTKSDYIKNKPTTISGYGITDAYINTTTRVITLGDKTITVPEIPANNTTADNLCDQIAAANCPSIAYVANNNTFSKKNTFNDTVKITGTAMVPTILTSEGTLIKTTGNVDSCLLAINYCDMKNYVKSAIENIEISGGGDSPMDCAAVKSCVKDALADNNSTINHAVDTIVENHLADYTIKNCNDVITCVNNAIADGTSTTNLAIDTIVKNVANNLIKKAAADSLISARELKDSLSNYTETNKLCDYITTNCSEIAHKTDIPTVNNSQITIKDASNTTVGSFTLNQSGATTIILPASATVNDATLTITDGTNTYKKEFTANDADDQTVTLSRAAFTGSYTDLSNAPTLDIDGQKIIIGNENIIVPAAANNATITIQNNGTTVGAFSVDASSNATINIIDEQTSKRYTATNNQTSFALTVPSGQTVNTTGRLVQFYINGVYVGDNKDGVVTVSGSTVTYVPAQNDGYALVAGDRVQIVYWTKK